MKWETSWWGITFTAENKEDRELLEKLQRKLPKELKQWETCYENGIMACTGDENFIKSEFGENNTNEFQLMFRR